MALHTVYGVVMEAKTHSIILTATKTEIEGVVRVIGIGEKEAAFDLGQKRLSLQGEGIVCESVDLERGYVRLQGEVRALSYKTGVAVGGVLKRLLK